MYVRTMYLWNIQLTFKQPGKRKIQCTYLQNLLVISNPSVLKISCYCSYERFSTGKVNVSGLHHSKFYMTVEEWQL